MFGIKLPDFRKDYQRLKRDLRQILRPYYVINLFLSLSYIVAKKLPYFCHFVFSDVECEIDTVSKLSYFQDEQSISIILFIHCVLEPNKLYFREKRKSYFS